ncbi:MAG TPA: UDP-N-acetylmuramoyl-L-alanine--D-glutamate ligase [Gemmatimonadaceae bacterium]
MIPRAWRQGEVAVIGLGASGRAATELLLRDGLRVYASDASSSDAAAKAAASLGRLGASVEAGGHDLARVARAAVVVASPGVPPDAAPLARARAAGVPVVSEIEVGLRYLAPSTRYIAITGTNGKTTTTAMVGQLLRALGVTAVDAGNIGTPLTEIALAATPPKWVSLEVSSFQLHDTPSIAPAVGVLTNLSPDHLDRYASVEDYYADKGLLFANASASSKWVVNGDDDEVARILSSRRGGSPAAAAPGTKWPLAGVVEFSLAEQADAYYDRAADALVVLGTPLLARRDLALFGDHNVANALAASLAVMVADPAHATPASRARIAGGLTSFKALQHRLESVGEVDGVLWINDSKATNVSSTLVAIEGMTRPTVLLLGGRHKGEPYTALAEPLRRIGRAVIAYGEAGPIVAHDLEGVVPLVHMGSDFESVIAKARSLAQPGDVVLLSPACSSYDMFNNYAERGATFRRLAMANNATAR